MTLRPLATIRNDSRVEGIDDERCHGDGIWVYLKVGYCLGFPSSEEHTIHEDSLVEVYEMMNHIFPCDCGECVDELRFGHNR